MAGRRAGAPSLEGLFVGAFALLGLRIGLQPVGDNSAFWHIRTGIDIVAGRGVPRSDPYSWTAADTPWVLQSWLAEVAYGVADRLLGLHGVVLLNGVLLAVVAGGTAVLARTGSARRTAAAAGISIAVAAGWWSPRPLLFGLALLVATVAVDSRRMAWWLMVPIGALWVNVHGSFVLGAAWIALAALGSVLDRQGADLRGAAMRLAGFVTGAIIGAAASPPGPRLLSFPLGVLQRRDAFSAVLEWQRPRFFAGPVEVLALVAVVAAVAVVAWKRPPLRTVVPAGVFLVAGLVSQRNLAPAGVALAPALAIALQGDAESVQQGEPGPNRAFAAVMALAAAVFVVGAWRAPAIDLDGYPVAAFSHIEREGLRPPGTRIVHTDVTGGWLILVDGRDADVFVDDRVDMYPEPLLADYRALVRGNDAARDVLEARQAELLVWPTGEPLLDQVARGGWERSYRDDAYEVWVRS